MGKTIGSSTAINGYGIKIQNKRITLKGNTILRIEKLLRRRIAHHNVDGDINLSLDKIRGLKK